MDQSSEDEKTPLILEEVKLRKKSFVEILRDEFRWRSFGFDFSNETAFYRSQWRFPRLIFVLFRLSLALYTGTICILTLVYFPRKNPHRPWIVWMTNWSYLLLTCHEILAATIVLVHSNDRTTGGFCCRELEDGGEGGMGGRGHRRGSDAGKMKEEKGREESTLPFYMKLSWLLYCVSSTVAIISCITFLSTSDVRTMPVKGLHNHVINGFVAMLDLCVSAFPVRLFHLVYITIYSSIYYLFSYIFWSFDHTQNVLYFGSIDWNEPRDTMIGWVFAAILRPLGVHVILFIIYRLKLFITAKIYGDEE